MIRSCAQRLPRCKLLLDGVGVHQTQRQSGRRLQVMRLFSGSSSSNHKDDDEKVSATENPEKFVSGLSTEQVQADPKIAAFFVANFGGDDTADGDEDDIVDTDGFIIPPEILEEYGIEVEEMADPTTREYDRIKIDKGIVGQTPEQLERNIRIIRTQLRESHEEGTNQCKRLRYHNLIPGMIFGGNPQLGISHTDENSQLTIKTPWPELQRELGRYHRHFESRVYDLQVYENDNFDQDSEIIETHRVMPSGVQRHPVKGNIYCTNFVRYHPGRPVKLPIKYINVEESPALKRSGFIVPVNKYVECLIEDGVPIPEYLELECTGIMLKDVIRLDRIIFPDGVRISDRINVDKFIIGPVQGGRAAAMADDDDETGGEDGEPAAEATG